MDDLFSRIPFLKKYNLREVVGLRGVWGEISEENKALSTTGNPLEFPLWRQDRIVLRIQFWSGEYF